jgi:glutathione synthase/RimK-type ligase-like ATP-grasp enzyme
VILASCRADRDRDRDLPPLLEALAARGIGAEVSIWDDPSEDWSGADACIVCSTWDYHTQREAFLAWAARITAVSVLWNPLPVLRWNSHKGYLRALRDLGIPVVPSVWVERGAKVSLDAVRSEHGWSRVVVKPAVSASAEGLARLDDDGPANRETWAHLVRAEDAIVQPYVESVEAEGEVSIVLVEGRPTHAVRKRPGRGDYRVQRRYGGSVEAHDPTDEERELAVRCLRATGFDALYARVDLVRDDDAALLVGELELIEPELYLPQGPGSADALAGAIEGRLRARR